MVAALNIGGIANITVVTPDEPPLAFDTGPGNALLDAAARMISHGGRGSRTSTATSPRRAPCGEDLLEILLADPYYAVPPPKSTGKEHFHVDYLRRGPGPGPARDRPTDLLATLVELTATTVARRLPGARGDAGRGVRRRGAQPDADDGAATGCLPRPRWWRATSWACRARPRRPT